MTLLQLVANGNNAVTLQETSPKVVTKVTTASKSGCDWTIFTNVLYGPTQALQHI